MKNILPGAYAASLFSGKMFIILTEAESAGITLKNLL
jgi:hypothetical protein